MKHIILVTTALIIAASLSAQVKKGSIIIGTNYNINATLSNAANLEIGRMWMRNSQMQLELGKAIKDDMVAGIRIGYGSAPAGVYKKINQTEYLTYSANHFSSGSLFLRQYARLRKNILLFIEYAATGSVGPYKTFGYDDSARRYSVDMKLRNIGVGLSLGIAYKISERVAIDLSFNNLLGVRFASTKGNYIYNNSGLTIPSSTTQFTFDPFSGARLNASFGIKIRLNKN